jgi:hypothetical protein
MACDGAVSSYCTVVFRSDNGPHFRYSIPDWHAWNRVDACGSHVKKLFGMKRRRELEELTKEIEVGDDVPALIDSGEETEGS